MIRRLALVLTVAALVSGAGMLLRAEPPQAVGTWASIGTAPENRIGAAAVALPDGRTLIAGGLANGTATDAVVVFDPADSSFAAAGQLREPRAGHTATLLEDGHILIAGGKVNDILTGDLEIFDPSTGTTTPVAALIQMRSGHSAARLGDGTVLIAGGTGTDGVLQSAEIFDPSTGTASSTTAMQMARTAASATTLIDGRVLIAGGNDGTQDLASAEIYNPSTQQFQATDTNLDVPRSGHAAVLLPHNNSVLIAGGSSNEVPQASVDLFLPAQFPDPYTYGMGQFAATGDMAAPRSGAAGGPNVEGYAFVVGGGQPDAEVYRFATVKTDKDDYPPGQTAIITGSGWEQNEEVTLLFQEDPAVHDDYVLTVTADGEGNIYHDQWAPEQHDANVRFYLMAKQATSGGERRAQTTFTDSLSITSATVNGVTSGVTAVVGQPITATVNVSATQQGGNNWKATGWRISTTAPGTITCVDHADHTTNGPQSETFPIFGSALGLQNVYFQLFQNDNCTGLVQASTTLANSVTITAASTTTAITSDNPDPSNTAQAVTVQVLVSPVAPSTAPINEGTVTVNATGGLSCTTGTLSAGVGSCQITFATGGAKTITATYPGTANYLTSTSAVESHTVNAANAAPVLNPIGNNTVNEQTLLSFTATATDSDVPAQSLTFSLDGGAPAGAAITPGGLFTWTPTEAQGPGDYPVTVRVTDNGTPTLDDFETITIHVDEVNVAPALNTIGAQAVDEGTLLSFTATATDADVPANSLTFSLAACAVGDYPTGAAITPGGAFTWTPTEAQGPNSYCVKIVVTDDGTPPLADNEEVTITVAEVNVAPALTTIGAQSVDEEVLLSFMATATDTDDPPNGLTFTLENCAAGTFPVGAAITTGGAFTWTPTEAQGPNSYCVKIVVTDDGTPPLADNEEVTITVAEVNVAPALTTIGAQSVDEEVLLSFTATATDTDDPPNGLTFTLENCGAGTFPVGAAITTGGAFTWTPTETQGPNSYCVKIVVTDDGTPPLADNEEVTITVAEVNVAPSLSTIGSKSVVVGNTLTFGVSATDDDIPLNTLTFSLDAGAPAGTSIITNTSTSPAAGTFSWTPALAQTGMHSMTVRVTDNGTPVLSDSETIQVMVRYGVCLQYDPTKSHKKGSTIPLKITLCNASGNNVSSESIVVQAVSITKQDNSPSPFTAEDSGSANPDNNFRYAGGFYIYNLSLKSSGFGTGTWKMSFTVNGVSDLSYVLFFDVK